MIRRSTAPGTSGLFFADLYGHVTSFVVVVNDCETDFPAHKRLALETVAQREPAGTGEKGLSLLGSRGLAIERPGQVWAADITYIPMARGFLYLVVIMDRFSRAVLAWRLSNICAAEFCVGALAGWPAPDIFNSERGAPLVRATARTQGSQFTSQAFAGVLEDHGVRIGMAGLGRFMDNIFVVRLWRSRKYEEPYLKAYDSVAEAGAWLAFYNTERPHQGLGYQTPREVFDGATRPVDKWKAAARLATSAQAPQQHQTKTDSKEGKMVIPSSRMPQLQSVEDRIQVGGSQPYLGLFPVQRIGSTPVSRKHSSWLRTKRTKVRPW